MPRNFEVGRNLALTPGKVIYQNDLMQLIQYAPTTEKVLKAPLLIVPPWINKFYILDLTPEKSFIKWCVDQGLTVFVRLLGQSGRAARRTRLRTTTCTKGRSRRSTSSSRSTGETEAHTHRLLRRRHAACASPSPIMAAKDDDRVVSATLFAAQVDFTYAGDLKVFVDEEQIAALERQMAERGYLEGSQDGERLQHAALQRPDLALCDQQLPQGQGAVAVRPALLELGRDADAARPTTRSICATAISRTTSRKGEMEIAGEHARSQARSRCRSTISPRAKTTSRRRNRSFSARISSAGRCDSCSSGSGHIAGVVNPPARQNISIGPAASRHGDDLDDWLAKADEHPGSWWPDWIAWLKAQDAQETRSRAAGGGKFEPIEDAPGSYVRVRGD